MCDDYFCIIKLTSDNLYRNAKEILPYKTLFLSKFITFKAIIIQYIHV
jgi:hypothetical protein